MVCFGGDPPAETVIMAEQSNQDYFIISSNHRKTRDLAEKTIVKAKEDMEKAEKAIAIAKKAMKKAREEIEKATLEEYQAGWEHLIKRAELFMEFRLVESSKNLIYPDDSIRTDLRKFHWLLMIHDDFYRKSVEETKILEQRCQKIEDEIAYMSPETQTKLQEFKANCANKEEKAQLKILLL